MAEDPDLEEALRLSRESYERERAQLPTIQIDVQNDQQDELDPPPAYSETDPIKESHRAPSALTPSSSTSTFTSSQSETQPLRSSHSPTLPPRPLSPRLPPRPNQKQKQKPKPSNIYPGRTGATYGSSLSPAGDQSRPALPQRRY